MTTRSIRLLRWLAAACLTLVLVACGNRVELMASMPEGEANEVMATLINAGIPASKISGKEGMVGLSVEAADVGRAVELLQSRGLPRERFAGMGEVFRKEGLISSPLEERARYIYALSQELRGTLAQIDGVVAARVHVVLPERSSSSDPATPSSAAVFIKHQEGFNLETLQPQIRKLVTNSIPNLAADRVSIVLIASQSPPGAQPSAMASVPRTENGVSLLVAALAGALLVSLISLALLAWKLRELRKPATGANREAKN